MYINKEKDSIQVYLSGSWNTLVKKKLDKASPQFVSGGLPAVVDTATLNASYSSSVTCHEDSKIRL